MVHFLLHVAADLAAQLASSSEAAVSWTGLRCPTQKMGSTCLAHEGGSLMRLKEEGYGLVRSVAKPQIITDPSRCHAKPRWPLVDTFTDSPTVGQSTFRNERGSRLNSLRLIAGSKPF